MPCHFLCRWHKPVLDLRKPIMLQSFAMISIGAMAQSCGAADEDGGGTSGMVAVSRSFYGNPEEGAAIKTAWRATDPKVGNITGAYAALP